MVKAVHELVEEHKDAPEKDAVEFNPNQSDQLLVWKWTEDEIQEALKWIANPVTRVRFLRARYFLYN
jgi:hypothetical protein